jgi:hypothetical protein
VSRWMGRYTGRTVRTCDAETPLAFRDRTQRKPRRRELRRGRKTVRRDEQRRGLGYRQEGRVHEADRAQRTSMAVSIGPEQARKITSQLTHWRERCSPLSSWPSCACAWLPVMLMSRHLSMWVFGRRSDQRCRSPWSRQSRPLRQETWLSLLRSATSEGCRRQKMMRRALHRSGPRGARAKRAR